jgi:hypothetical protein
VPVYAKAIIIKQWQGKVISGGNFEIKKCFHSFDSEVNESNRENIEGAFELFYAAGIKSVTMDDIAKAFRHVEKNDLPAFLKIKTNWL